MVAQLKGTRKVEAGWRRCVHVPSLPSRYRWLITYSGVLYVDTPAKMEIMEPLLTGFLKHDLRPLRWRGQSFFCAFLKHNELTIEKTHIIDGSPGRLVRGFVYLSF